MKVGGTKVGFRGRWVSNAPTEVLRQKSGWVEKKKKRGGGHLSEKGKQIRKLGQL